LVDLRRLLARFMIERSFFVQFSAGIPAVEAVNICLSATENSVFSDRCFFKVH
jgi:hypothetical protein